jgi:dihydrofolate reductase
MATVMAEMSMSLDGFIADPSDRVGPLFDRYGTGDVEVPTAVPERWTFRTSEASAAHLRDLLDSVGALVEGRRVFDVAGGWGGKHPLGAPVFVVTHSVPEGWPREDAPFTFVTDGIESAIAQAKAVAGDAIVGVGGADIAQQCLNAGLLDEIRVDLVPVLLGQGIPFFANLANGPVRLEGPTLIEGDRVTHLYYRVVKPDRGH